jgi:hypothetical protein
LRGILRHCGVAVTTPHSSGFSRLVYGDFYKIVAKLTFYGFTIYLENVDKAFQRALKAGAEIRMPVQDMFWGDRVGAVHDPFGYSWSLATHTKDLTPEELREGAKAAFTQMAKK